MSRGLGDVYKRQTLLTIYDMSKAVSKEMEIRNIHLISKSGGKSGDFKWQDK